MLCGILNTLCELLRILFVGQFRADKSLVVRGCFVTDLSNSEADQRLCFR